MLLYACGCSCTYGDELKNPKQDAWPVKLANKLQVPVINTGLCGGSDLYIYKTVLNFILSKQYDYDDIFIVIGWTTKRRCEVCVNDNVFPQCWRLKSSKKDFKNIFLNHFLENFIPTNPYMYTILLSMILNKYNIKYLFFNTYNLDVNLNTVFMNCYDIKNYLYSYTFNSFYTTHNYPLGERHHPLEEAHENWANYLYDHIKQNNILGD